MCCVSVCVCFCMCMSVCLCVYMIARVCVCVHVSVCVHLSGCLCVHVSLCACLSLCVYVCVPHERVVIRGQPWVSVLPSTLFEKPYLSVLHYCASLGVLGQQVHTPLSSFKWCFWDFKFGSSYLHSKLFIHWAICPVLVLLDHQNKV